MAEYYLDLGVVDTVPPAIVNNSLPTGTSQEFFGGFSLNFNKDMLAATVNDVANYSMIGSGPDLAFSTPDDVIFAVAPGAYSSGLSNSYSLPAAPLQPGTYRFTVGTGVRDKSGNPLPVAFVREFTIVNPSGYITEFEPNNSAAAANQLTFNGDISGYLTANARGALLSSGEQDFWKFNAEAGDSLDFEVALPFESSGTRLYWYLTDPDGVQVFNRILGTDTLESNPPSVLAKTGSYTLRVSEYNGVRTEYRFRATLLRGMAYESEDNGTIGNSDPVVFGLVNSISTATVAGFISSNPQLDYFDIGIVAPGNTVFLTVRRPAGSVLGPIVSLYNAGGQLQGEVNGVAGDDTAEVQITTSGRYHALIRANLGTAGINGDYVLDVRSVPTNSINFPNLRVTQLDEIGSTTLKTGDTLPIRYQVGNVGTLGTGASSWVDRVVISPNPVYGDGDDIQLALVPRSGALAAGGNYTVDRNVVLPDGLPGSYYLMVRADSANAVDEALFESDNTTVSASPFPVGLRDYPDLVIEGLNVSGPDVSGNYDIGWNLANSGSAAAPAGQETRVQVVNVTTGLVLTDVTTSISAPLAAGATVAQTRQVTTLTPGFYSITITADSTNLLYEFAAGGHASAEQNSSQSSFQIFRYYNIQVSASPPAGGAVTGGGSIRDGLPVTITATPDTSSLPYTFVNWTENGTFVTSQPSYTFIAGQDRNLVAVFTLPQYFIAATSTPPGSGTVGGGGTYSLGSTVSLTANAAQGYTFDYWEEGGNSIGTVSPLQFTASADRSIKAIFRELNLVHAVTVATQPAGIAVIPGAGNYNNGSTIDITAPPTIPAGANEYVFQRFQLNGSNVSGGNRLVKTVSTADPASMAYVAVYTTRPFKPVVQSIVTNHSGNVLPVNVETRFTVTFDRAMDTSVQPDLVLSSLDSTSIPGVPAGSWTNDQTWRSGPVVFVPANGGNYSLAISLAKDASNRTMDPDSSFTFSVDPLLPLSAPVISPATGTYAAAVTVSISSGTPGATIRYTTDGTDPTSNSQVYGGTFVVGATTTVRAKAFKAGYHDSSVVSRIYTIDTDPPVITAFRWEAAPLINGATLIRRGTLAVTATDNQGVASAEFFYRPGGSGTPVLIGQDNQPGNGLTAVWNVESITDGAYSVIVRVYDTVGTWSETTRSISLALAVPAAPQIVSPATGSSVQDPTVALSIQSLPDGNVRIFRDNVFIFSGYTDSNGILNYSASLPEGTSVFKAVAINRAGSSVDSNSVSVIRVREFPQLVIGFGQENTLMEGGTLTGTVSLPAPASTNVLVQISTDKPGRVNSGDVVTIPAGSASAPFTLEGRQNITLEPLTQIRVFATAPEHRNAFAEIFLADDDTPVIELVLSQNSVSENQGTLTGMVSRGMATAISLRVHLTSSNPSEASVPLFVDIPAHQTQATFDITVLDDTLDDGNLTTVLRGAVLVGGGTVAQTSDVTLEVRDDEGPALALEISRPFVQEGTTLTGVIRRSGGLIGEPLAVTLSQSPGSDFVLPTGLAFAAGQVSIPFAVDVPVNPSVNGTRRINLRVAAAAHTDGLVPVTVTDVALPELAPSQLAAPSTGLTEQVIDVSYRVNNFGAVSVIAPFTERVFLSTDPYPSADDVILRQNNSAGEIIAGGSYVRNVPLFAPRQTGTYYLIVTLDPVNVVTEVDETNNTAVLIQPIVIRAAYGTVVSVAPEVIPTNTPITFTGSATKDNGEPAPFSMVNIHINLNGTKRIISAVTNSLGQFSTVWTPLRNEGGVYNIGAAHPGVSNAPDQDAFEILTLGFSPPSTLNFKEGETVVANAMLRNPNTRPLTGIRFTVGSLPPGLTITPALPVTTIPAGGELTVPVAVSAAAGYSGNGAFPLTVETNEGVIMQGLLYANVDLLKPVLTLDPTAFNASVLRGGSKSVSLTITNTGGLESGEIKVLLPAVPWMTLVSSEIIDSLAPGASAAISVQLAPGIEVALTEYKGTIGINAANGGGKNVPFTFRVVSDLKGDLKIETVDEEFYFTEAAPKLAGATVVVRDAISSAEVVTGTTAANGSITFVDLTEGWYRVDVTAPQHDRWSTNVYVNAGRETFRQGFLSRQWVSYSWTVEEVEIQDVYRVSIETVFETNVPAPVVTISPGVLDVQDLIALGQSKTVNFTIQNHGLINADHGLLNFGDHPFYEITPLVENIGLIPAKSSLTVPVMVRRIGTFDDEGNVITLNRDGSRSSRAAPRANVPCGFSGKLSYDYVCGVPVAKVIGIPGSGVAGNCGRGPGTSGGGFYGGGYYYGGPGTGSGGGSGGSGTVSYTTPSSSDCPCFEEICFEAGAKVNLGAIGEALAGAISAALPPYASLDDVDVSVEGNGKICFCCVDGEYGLSGSASATATVTVSGTIGFSPDINGIDTNVNGYSNVTLEASALAGARIEGTGSITLSLEKPCREEGKACFGGSISLSGFAGVEADGTASATFTDPVTGLSTGVTGVGRLALGVNLSASASVTGCSDGSVTYNACASAEPEATAQLTLSAPGGTSAQIGGSVDLPKWSAGTCGGDRNSRPDRDIVEGPEVVTFVVPGSSYMVPDEDLLATAISGEPGQKSGICATVKVKLDQDVVMTRTAFRGTLELNNNRADAGLTNVGFDLQVRDADGQPAADLFNIQVTKLTGLAAIDGTGSIGTKSSGSAQWTLIPRDTAAQEENRVYTIGGVIRYTQDGTDYSIPVENVPITVRPDASLDLKYFHQRDVISDDPHTDAIEPAQPYKLAVVVENKGFGTARKLHIISGQPQIVENEKGLLIDFKIIGTEVDGQPLSPSLTADFGDLLAGQRKIATWLMTSSLQGNFIDYKATFEHVTGLGDERISLLKNVEIHEMIRAVLAQGAGEDSAPDFLVNDVADPNDYPDTIHYSDGGTDLVTVRETGSFTGSLTPGNLSVTLNTGAFSGWSYIRLPDPGSGNYRLVSAVRSDGRVLPLDMNVWQSDRTFIGNGKRPIYERILHLADRDSGGQYTLTYQPVAAPDSIPPSSRVNALAALSLPQIPVNWTGSDNIGVAAYDVFVSANGGPFVKWKDRTASTGAIYLGDYGSTYDFYSIAYDNAGNVETKASSAEASTEVGVENDAPSIELIGDFTIPEGSFFTYRAIASDPDGNAEDLRFSLGTSSPGVVIDPITGVISWQTGENDGGRSVSVIVVATDAGTPPAVANRGFMIHVTDVNVLRS